MFLATVELDWGSRGKITQRELPEETYHTLRREIPALTLPEDYSETGLKGWYTSEMIMDEREVGLLTDAGLQLNIRRLKGMQYPAGWPHRMGKSGPDMGQNITMVSVPNVGLLSVTNVTWLENACTQELQGWLNKGWRILAVCPPNDQRRPDYILGHTDTEAVGA